MRKGFTLVEILVVIAISAMLTAITLVYTRVAQNEVALSVETAKIAGFVLRAKDLAISTYNASAATCAYGVSFNIPADTYSIFAYVPQDQPGEHTVAPPCPAATVASTSPFLAGEVSGPSSTYSQGTWNVPVADGVKLVDPGAGNTLASVLFYPPEPVVFMNLVGGGNTFLDPDTASTSYIYLETVDGKTSSTISVNGAGQVTF